MTRSLVIALCIILTGCDATQFFYNRANWLLAYEARYYFDLHSSQKTHVKKDISQFLDWHRRTQLLCYADLIDHIELRASSTLSATDLTWLENELTVSYDTLLSRAMIPTAGILSDLDTKQITHLEKRLAKDQKKLEREYGLKPERQKKHRSKETISGLKKWFGELSRTQVNWVKTRSDALPNVIKPWLNYRVQRDQALIQLLHTGSNPETIIRVIKPMWANTDSLMTDKAQALMEELRTQSIAMAVDFYATTTPRQKSHFWKRLSNYRKDFRQLANVDKKASCEPPAPPIALNGTY